jgi:hypothetical protein
MMWVKPIVTASPGRIDVRTPGARAARRDRNVPLELSRSSIQICPAPPRRRVKCIREASLVDQPDVGLLVAPDGDLPFVGRACVANRLGAITAR